MQSFEDFWNWLTKSQKRFKTLGNRASNTASVLADVLIITITKSKKSTPHRRLKKSVIRDFEAYPGTASQSTTNDTLYVHALIRDWMNTPNSSQSAITNQLNPSGSGTADDHRKDPDASRQPEEEYGNTEIWREEDVVRVEHIESVTIESSFYQSFGPCSTTRLTIERNGTGFRWRGNKVASKGPNVFPHISLPLQCTPVPPALEPVAASIFDELAVSYSSLANQCKDILDRFPTSPSSLTITIKTADQTWQIITTSNPFDGYKLPAVILKLRSLFAQMPA